MVVEADAFKETDVIYRAISSMGHHNDMLQTAELVRYLYLNLCAVLVSKSYISCFLLICP